MGRGEVVKAVARLPTAYVRSAPAVILFLMGPGSCHILARLLDLGLALYFRPVTWKRPTRSALGGL